MDALKALLYRCFGPEAAAYLTSLQELSMLPPAYNSINFHLLLHSNVPWTEEEIQLIGKLVTSPFLKNETPWRQASSQPSRSGHIPPPVPQPAPRHPSSTAYPAATAASSYLYEMLQGVSSGYDLLRWLLLLDSDASTTSSVALSTAMNTLLPLVPTHSQGNNWNALSPQQRDAVLSAIITIPSTSTSAASPPPLHILKGHLSALFIPPYSYYAAPPPDPYYYAYASPATMSSSQSMSSVSSSGSGGSGNKGMARLKYSPEMKLTAAAHYYRAGGDLSEAIASLHTNPAYRRVTKTMLSRWVKSDPLEEKPKGGRPYSAEFEQAVIQELFSGDNTPTITYEGVRTAGLRVRENSPEFQTNPLTKDLKFSDKWVRGFLRRNNLTTTSTAILHDTDSDCDM